MADTAAEMLEEAGYTKAELRYHQGLSPQTMASRHYAGYDCPAEQAKMGAMQDALRVQIMGCHSQPQNHHQQIAEGRPLCTTTMRCIIVIPPGTVAGDLFLKLTARFGQNVTAKVLK